MSTVPKGWTEEELEYLRTHTSTECVEHLNRTLSSIYHMRCVCKITAPRRDKKKPEKPAQRWTDDELIYLRTHTNAECAEHLDRTYGAIGRMRSVCGWKSPGINKWTAEQDSYLCENFGKLSLAELAKHIGHSEKSTYARLSKLHLLVDKRHWSDNEVSVLKDMCSKGRTVYEISEALGRSPGAVRQRCAFEGAVPFYETPDWAEDV